MAKYEKIADDLRARIRAGEWPPGAQLPSETPALTTEFKVSLPTLRQAIGVLVTEGLIEKEHGRGNFVRRPRRGVERSNQRHQWEKDRARLPEATRLETGATEHDTGLTVSDLVFTARFRECQANDDLASVFEVPVGTRLLERVYRTRYRQEDEPFNLVHSFLVYDVVAANPELLDETKEPWPGGTQNQLHTIDIELDHIEERITARPPTAEEAEELGIKAGVSVLIDRKVSVDTNGRAVEVSDITLPGDRTEMVFTTPLNRW